MIVGVCTVRLSLSEALSLKDKRRTVKSLLERARRRFAVAAAEVDAQDLHTTALLAFVCVANQGRQVDSVLQSLVNWLDAETAGQVAEVSIEHR